MGPVPAEVVIATFFNFAPAEVHRCIPEAWAIASPAAFQAARRTGIDGSLRRILGDTVDGPEIAEAAELARTASEACTPEGRTLYAAHAALDWPDAPHLVLWHALSLAARAPGRRPHRLPGGRRRRRLSGPRAPRRHGRCARPRPAGHDGPAPTRSGRRRWRRCRPGAGSTPTARSPMLGRTHRQGVEDRTDELALAPWRHLGADGCDRLRALVRPFSQAIVAAGSFGAARRRDDDSTTTNHTSEPNAARSGDQP